MSNARKSPAGGKSKPGQKNTTPDKSKPKVEKPGYLDRWRPWSTDADDLLDRQLFDCARGVRITSTGLELSVFDSAEDGTVFADYDELDSAQDGELIEVSQWDRYAANTIKRLVELGLQGDEIKLLDFIAERAMDLEMPGDAFSIAALAMPPGDQLTEERWREILNRLFGDETPGLTARHIWHRHKVAVGTPDEQFVYQIFPNPEGSTLLAAAQKKRWTEGRSSSVEDEDADRAVVEAAHAEDEEVNS